MLKRFTSPKARSERRAKRAARWAAPLATRRDRLIAWLHMIVVDHGFFRLLYLNRHKVTPAFWRAAQPTPGQIRRAVQEGARTIVTLRGASGRLFGSYALEREACAALGVPLVEFRVDSRGAPDRSTMAGAAAFFDSLAYPVLAHCKSGADRAGFMAALYLLVHEKRPVEEAMRQLSMRYGHFAFAKTGILDAFFDSYRREGQARGLSFQTWVETVYDPVALTRSFKTNWLADLIVGKLLRRE